MTVSKEQSLDHKSAAIVSKAVCRAADSWDITNEQLKDILGVSGSTISRLKRSQFFLNKASKEWELALLFLRAFRGLDAYMGGHTGNEKSWLAAHNDALNGIPIELMQTVEGLANVVQYIDCVRGR